MAKTPFFVTDTSEQSDIGPYDGQTSDPPWFLAQDDGDTLADIPLPRVNRRALIDPRDWGAAQSELAADLASVAMLFGALDERLRTAPKGWRHRLALLEATELSWWVGDRIAVDRLALWDTLRLAGAQDDSQELGRAGWALRRLSGGPDLSASSPSLAEFLGRHMGADTTADGVEDLADLLRSADHLHPITQSAIVFHGWRMLGQGGAATEIEATVLAARLASLMGRVHPQGRGAVFMPIALAGFAAHKGGPVIDRLSAWLRGAERATLAALLHLGRLADWQGRATTALADLQGRTPAHLIAAIAEWPMVSAPMAETITKSSRATVQRNLALMQTRGLIREVTGQGRYRVWTAKI